MGFQRHIVAILTGAFVIASAPVVLAETITVVVQGDSVALECSGCEVCRPQCGELSCTQISEGVWQFTGCDSPTQLTGQAAADFVAEAENIDLILILGVTTGGENPNAIGTQGTNALDDNSNFRANEVLEQSPQSGTVVNQ